MFNALRRYIMHGKGNRDSVREEFHAFVKAGAPVILSEESFLLGCGARREESAILEGKIERLAWMMEGLDCEYWIALRGYRALAFSYFIELGLLTLWRKGSAPSWWLRESNAFGILHPAELMQGLAALRHPIHWLNFADVTSGALKQRVLGLGVPLPHRHATKARRSSSIWRGRRGVLEELADTLGPSLLHTLLRGWIHYGRDITRTEEVEAKHWDEGGWAESRDLEEAWEAFRRERLDRAEVMEGSRLRLG